MTGIRRLRQGVWMPCAVTAAIALCVAVGCSPNMFEGDDHDSTSGSSAPGTTTGGSTTTGGTTSGSTTTGGTTGGTTTGGTTTGGTTGGVTPPLGGSSNGSGGGQGSGYRLRVPPGYSQTSKWPLLMAYSGVEGSSAMMSNLQGAGSAYGLGGYFYVVLDGSTASASSGAAALDDVRARYNIDNDKTVILTESAGTRAGLTLGLQTRQSYFAAVWANDCNAVVTPTSSASQLGFTPSGGAGGGTVDYNYATQIVSAMSGKGYTTVPAQRDPSVAHGSTQTFLYGLQFLAGKKRQ